MASARQVLLVEGQPELETLGLSGHVSPETPGGKKWLLREDQQGASPNEQIRGKQAQKTATRDCQY